MWKVISIILFIIGIILVLLGIGLLVYGLITGEDSVKAGISIAVSGITMCINAAIWKMIGEM